MDQAGMENVSDMLLPPGTESVDSRQYSFEERSRSSSREYDRSRRDRSRERRFDREEIREKRFDYEENRERRFDYEDGRERRFDHEDGRERRFDRDGSREMRIDYEEGRERRFDREDRRESSSEFYHGRNSHSSRDYDRRSYRDHYRDRSRDHNRERTRDRSRDRDRSKDHDWKEEIPHNTIMVKGLAPHLTESDIKTEIVRYSLFPKDIVLMRKKHTGESQGFAFVEFRLLSDAVRWKELTRGVVYFGQFRATLHYFVAKDTSSSDRLLAKRADWTCNMCGLNNFRKRDLCFKCNLPREDIQSERSEGREEVSYSPSSTLLFRNLDILTTEERVLSMLGQLTVLSIKNLKVAKDLLTNTSRGFAYVELHTISEAMQLHDLLLSMGGNFYVDGRQVTVSYSQRRLSGMNSAASANAASVALAAAQWTNQNDANSHHSNDSKTQLENEAAHSNNKIITGQQYQAPNLSSYQYDESSGYYYDSVTGLYYDPNSQYYYNSESQQYLYWDAEKSTYLPAPSVTPSSTVTESASSKVPQAIVEAAASISSPPVIAHAAVLTTKKEIEPPQEKQKERTNPQDKVKIAKKVAKEMEKWAKMLNQKKESAKTGFVVPPPPTELPVIAQNTVDTSLQVQERKKIVEKPLFDIAKSEEDDDDEDNKSPVLEKASLNLIAAYGGESDSEPESVDDGMSIEELVKAEEIRLIDYTKLACLLCKRQFPTKEVLTKHTQLSDLHRQNVDMLKLSKLSSRQLQEMERKESGYRDRAKERREKFGQPDMPPPNRLKTKYMKDRKETFVPPEEPTKDGIGSDNIGNKMLKAMGWTEGQGLGKAGQGMSGIIEVQQRVKSAGLGMKGASYGAGATDSYKDAVRKAMQARYNEIT